MYTCACTSKTPSTQRIAYFQTKSPIYPRSIETSKPEVSRISQDDLLAITVSSLNKESNEILNFSNVNSLAMATTAGGGGGGSQPIGYAVDSLGTISMPFIGKQYVMGLTLPMAEEKIRLAIEKVLKDPAVSIRFMNHKFTVLGEANRVGIFSLVDDRTTLIEALSIAGDLTDNARRDSLTIIRYKNGLREIGTVNLLNQDVFASPYFYVKNGDVIYVAPYRDNMSTTTEQRMRRLQIGISLVTTLLVISNFFFR
ncbi:polysaccharide biosynthesis/export family protein [Rhabdobacter roseus]|nr:polysaccharide biosynthesis/export family protein [Rhabdobacter roseus]